MNELIASIDMNSKNRAIIYVDLHVWYILKKVWQKLNTVIVNFFNQLTKKFNC